jgi:hypothetical protein
MKLIKLQYACVWLILFSVFFAACNVSADPTELPSTITAIQIPPTSSPTSLPKPSPTLLVNTSSVEIIGEEEMIYDMSKDHCPDGGAPDLPIRAFRNSEGMVQFNLSSPTNFRMIGERFRSGSIPFQFYGMDGRHLYPRWRDGLRPDP